MKPTGQSTTSNDSIAPYSMRYVAFIDILGFSEIVTKHPHLDTEEKRLALVESLRSISDRELDKEYGEDFRFQQFSDSIVLSDTVSAVGLFNLLSGIAMLACELLENSLLIRGGLAKGLLHHDDQLIFGPSFIEAHNIESTIAQYPRIVVSPHVLADARNFLRSPEIKKIEENLGTKERLATLIRVADDGPAFVNILYDINDEYPSVDHDGGRKIILHLLEDAMHNPKHYQKLKWFAEYWNTSIRDPRFKISLDKRDWFSA
jgi:hypothetical protein